MAIYLGGKKVSGSGVQVDSALSATSTRPVTNQVITEALEDVGYNAWQKPSDWIDIRSGAQDNSIYFLVAHSADYGTYPTFAVKATISNSGTYDVFVDGINQATTASATETSLSWQTLALTSGFDVTYPDTLRTHIVRITPSVSTNNITGINTGSISNKGILWAHFTTTNYLSISHFTQSGTSPTASSQAPVWEAVTADQDTLKVSNISYAFLGTISLTTIPTLMAESNSSNTSCDYFCTYSGIRRIKLVNIKHSGYVLFRNAQKLETLETENCIIGGNSQYIFQNNYKLKKIPNLNYSAITNTTTGFTYLLALEPTFLDFSSSTGLKILHAYGGDTNRNDKIKGAVVSSTAPLDGSSPQINVSYTGMTRAALVTLFNSLPTVTGSQVCNITGATGAADLTAEDLAIATGKGWSVTR